MSNLEKKLAALSPEQRRILEQRLKQKATATKDNVANTDKPNISESLKKKGMDFSLIFFSGEGSSNKPDKYRLLLESSKFADQHGLKAVWTPERHFQEIGGLYPNPSVLGAALATVTKNIQLRAGSVVLPLHNPLRVAEEWSVVDNLSGGRVAISVATGWHPADFVLNPGVYDNRKELMFKNLEQIRQLWRGEAVKYPDITGKEIDIRMLPRPIQPELPLFLTASGNPATWEKAGEMGFNILCSLSNHPADGLKERIKLYREKREEHGHDPEEGTVAVMLHTYVGERDDEVKELVREPLRDYLDTFLDQYDTMNPNGDENVRCMLHNSRDSLIKFAFEKYFQMSSLMGSKKKCAAMVERLHQYGVDEIACLLDYGLEYDQIMKGLDGLKELNEWFTPAQQKQFI
ncbi:MupA/Atu3671 family FMN-dependent luciferase-like monooxygenase [Bacillus cereus group sp. N21]|uniref:MupA/Atu3671 family FMN-dependent luciferase-like monooxygenase n=1 Tax=Bacillus cereus group sp. N21 TaxID=2794591 RepID=UPI0018F33F83|nr:MupA/Atu3671 family FMN-dependent luciferase-like monooxygenase [Bacillus cereus group sp. N21]MBJ8030639.1 LLM class flavin-dependent oxidoreductase [Bacillus cereus group sp. N21]